MRPKVDCVSVNTAHWLVLFACAAEQLIRQELAQWLVFAPLLTPGGISCTTSFPGATVDMEKKRAIGLKLGSFRKEKKVSIWKRSVGTDGTQF